MTAHKNHSLIMWVFMILCSIATPHALAEEQMTQLYVYAPTLTLHAAQDESSQEYATLPYGELVTVSGPSTIETDSAWAHAQTEDATGFLSTRYLLPIPTPDITKGGIASLLINLSKVGAPTTQATESGSVTHQTYSHGVTHNLHENVFEDMVFTEETLSIEGIDLYQGFLLARAIVASEGPTSYILGVDPIVESGEDGTPFIMDDRDWQIIAIRQSTDKGTAGVYISFPERAD